MERLPLFDALARMRNTAGCNRRKLTPPLPSALSGRGRMPPAPAEEPHAAILTEVGTNRQGNLLDHLLEGSAGSYEQKAATRKPGVFDELLSHIAGRY